MKVNKYLEKDPNCIAPYFCVDLRLPWSATEPPCVEYICDVVTYERVVYRTHSGARVWWWELVESTVPEGFQVVDNYEGRHIYASDGLRRFQWR